MNPWEPSSIEKVKQSLLTVSRLAVAGRLDRGTAALVSGNLKTLLAPYEKAGPRSTAALTPEEDEYVHAHGKEPPGVRIGYYAIDNPEPTEPDAD
jgi:hypothetical protein